ncbi:TnsA endonuclease N-terminal domain-containing protein [Paraburkholderia sp. MMS20-SJTN17]|uniref:TnsA endonuclease N-terminal domain-containing protein n=1 Tax=Paraburkholderia translucens TaxID=2886945 RepID=A0ABS8KBD9_9BURK|nr:TnsA endonuclease N-terminal domain-containing protein [Paraburkholderia sp. MMS20-SJTN17]MCC8402054.1 TnsA endonuclease N-terminal domain-containing protein [Paraburkholderia sp. MMS20-SJTN17]
MKKRFRITAVDVQRWKDAGFGSGDRDLYRPWLTIRDVPSLGRKSRPWGLTAGRTHHVLSDIELHFFLHADFQQHVVDIREQYPLFPQSEIVDMAVASGITPPRYPGTSTPAVLTTDFLLTVEAQDGTRALKAYAVKSTSDLEGTRARRAIEKLELERRYWLARGVPWKLVTERDMDPIRTANLEWLSYQARLDNATLLAQASTFVQYVSEAWSPRESLRDSLMRAAQMIGLDSVDDADRLFRHCVWNHMISVDMTEMIKLSHPVTILGTQMPSVQMDSRLSA